MSFESIERANWSLKPVGGSIVLSNPEATMMIEFSNFEPAKKVELIE